MGKKKCTRLLSALAVSFLFGWNRLPCVFGQTQPQEQQQQQQQPPQPPPQSSPFMDQDTLYGLEEGYGGVCASVHSFDAIRHKSVYRVGVLAIRGFPAAYTEFNQTFGDYLTYTAGLRFDPPIRFEMKPLNFNLLFTDVEDAVVDFIYVNPSAFSCIESEFTARSLVSQISRRQVGDQTYDLKKFGGVMLARSDRDDIQSIYDFKDKIIAAASISGLGSGQMQFLEMQRAGLSYINDPKQLVFTSNQGKVVNDVLSGQFDVGFVRTDQLERTRDANGTLVNASLFKIIEPRTTFIDGVQFPFTASTPLYPEWNVAALDHVAEDVSEEVQSALLAISQHAAVGKAIRDCYALHNETYCDTSVAFPYGFVDGQPRCDTNPQVALLADLAVNTGRYSGWQTTLSYMQLRNMQEGTGFIVQDPRNNNWRCIRSVEMYDAISCPLGYSKKSKVDVDRGCSAKGLTCPEGSQCVCNPCTEILVCYNGAFFRGDCVPYRVLLPAIFVPACALLFLGVYVYVAYKRKMSDALWEVDPKELKFDSPMVVIGIGTFGYVHMAEYRGTQVAVKRILPAQRLAELGQTSSRNIESNPGLLSMPPGMFKKARRSGTISTTDLVSLTPRQLRKDLVLEMRQLSKLRHPCITTVMGAVISGVKDPMLVMEYMVFGSLYDVLRDGSLQTQVAEHQSQILQDIARGLRFLHGADPQVIHGDLKSKNVLIDSNFHAKVSDFGLSAKKRSGARGTPYWMSPELLDSRSCNTAESDIYAFGVLMFECYARQNPYEGEDPETVLAQICDRFINKRPVMPPNCPLKMEDTFKECVRWDPADRPTAEAIDLLLRVEGSVKERVFRLEKLNRELGEANAKIASASAMQLQHFACMSHEIRTPLNCIVGISSLMEEDSDLNAQQRDHVKMIASSGKLLRHIVDDVLDYSKLESGAMEVDIKPADLQEILSDSVNSMASSSVTKRRNVSIRTYYDPLLLPDIVTDSRRLQQILYNLLSNAVKFSREGGSVDLTAKLVPCALEQKPGTNETNEIKQTLQISVKDYGKGIEGSEFENIFHPFTQTKTGISNTEGGTGLGLSITRKLVQALGGDILVDSEVGKFSIFTLEFPCSCKVVDTLGISEKLRNVTFVFVEQICTEAEQILDVFRFYNVEFIRFENLESLKASKGSTWSPSSDRTYICLVRSSLFDKDIVEEVFQTNRIEIAAFGTDSGKGCEKLPHYYSSLTAVFPACLMRDMVRLAEGARRMPLSRPPSAAELKEEDLTALLKDLRILVAEDNLVNQKVCRSLLTRIGVREIVVVPDGQQAVEKAASQPFDLVLMDMQMPVMDGVEATRLIVRHNGPHPIPKVIFLSAHVSDSFRSTCLESGAVGFIPKPCTLSVLKQILTETVKSKPQEVPSETTVRRSRAVRFEDELPV